MAELRIETDAVNAADKAEVMSILNYESIFTKEQIDYITKRVARAAKDVLGDKLVDVILFGSYARGDFRDWSDIDILIIADVPSNREFSTYKLIIRNVMDVLDRTNLLIAPIVHSYAQFLAHKDSDQFLKNVNGEGVRVYA